jgi:hypothetical protein
VSEQALATCLHAVQAALANSHATSFLMSAALLNCVSQALALCGGLHPVQAAFANSHSDGLSNVCSSQLLAGWLACAGAVLVLGSR